ncbi:MAG: lytic transglycosylase domain-containing protein [Acidobacteria bacterium]|nr:lytic transglycosylase domain-containing protein [Acidobacteriota bacterium]
MKWVPLLIFALPCSAQTPTAKPDPASLPSLDAMRKSIERQKASIRKQTESSVQGSVSTSWFSTPWPVAPLPAAIPPTATPASITAPAVQANCDPIPPEVVSPIIRAASAKENVKEDLLRAVIQQESAFRPCAVSPKGAQGLMQLMPATAAELGVQDPFDPKQNVNAGAKLLAGLLTKYQGDVKLALSAYNAGSGAVDRAGGVPNFAETKNYIATILQKLFY